MARDAVGLGIGSALDGFLELPDKIVGGGRVRLKHPEGDRAEEALALAAIIYGEFLERSEPLIRHGVTAIARREMVGYLNEKALAEGAEAESDV